MHRKARDYAPPPLVSRLPSLVSRPSSPAHSEAHAPVPSSPAHSEAHAPVPSSPARSEASAPVPSSPVPPPQRPFRRQSRSAASRTAGTSKRSRQPTGDPRPPSPARGTASRARPGKSPGRGRSPFLVSAADGGGKKLNHFSSRRVRDGKSFSRSDVQKGSGPPRGRTLFAPKRSAHTIAPPGHRPGGAGSSRSNVPRYI